MVGPLRPTASTSSRSSTGRSACTTRSRRPLVPGVACESPSRAGRKVPLDNGNLAYRAAALLAEQAGVEAGVRLDIVKGIPVAGGMAGGSSDAAAALVACDALWGTKFDRSALLDLAARLGSDVPFCLLGGTAVGSGHGEIVAPAVARGTFEWVFALDREGMSTPAVSRTWTGSAALPQCCHHGSRKR